MTHKLILSLTVVFILVALTLATARSSSEGPLSVSSPDGRLVVNLTLPSGSGATAPPTFSVSFRGRELLRDSALGLVLDEKGELQAGAKLISTRRDRHDETYRVLAGKQNPIRNQYEELTLHLKSPGGHQSALIFRVFNDSVAFRYSIPEQDSLHALTITDEKSIFSFVGNPRTHVTYCDSYTTSHEALYESVPLTAVQRDKLIDLPALFEYEDGTAVAITEANLQHYAGMYLKKPAGQEAGDLKSDLSPLPGQTQVKVKGPAPMVSPWRVILVGENAGKLIESTVITSLNEPSRVKDTSWIKPGKTTWHWWNGTEGDPAGFDTKLDLRTGKYYIDFAARHGIAYHALVTTVESDLHPWYQQSGSEFAPGADTDALKPRPELEMDELARYAKEKGVGLRAWVHWKAIKDRLDEVFSQYERWGIRGLMVDFLDRDDQEMVELSERILEKAAQYHIHIQFHGVWKPTGRQRAFPNLFNHEGVLNLEYLKWSNNPTPEHNVTVPFTRMLAGPMDYHLGGFRSVRREDFKSQGVAPIVVGTRCHHLAMYVVYENPMPMVVDYPTRYEYQPGFDLIEQVPTTWDETRVLSAKVGDYIVLARRKGSDWYIGAMTDWTPRTLDVPLSFLPAGSYQAEIWSDTPQTEKNPNILVKNQRTVAAQDMIQAKLAAGGGWVMHIKPADR